MNSCPCLQVCRELSGEAVDYEEASGTGSDAEDALCVLLLVNTQTSQPDLDSIKEALLEVRLLSKSEQVHCLSQSLDGKAMTCTTTWLHKIRTSGATGVAGTFIHKLCRSMSCRGCKYCSNQ